MAGGPIDGALIEFEQTAGVWTDISAYLKAGSGISIQFGLDNPTDDGQPSSVSFTLDNGDGRFTADNPTSAYYPNVARGKRVRVTMTKGATTSCRGTFITRDWKLQIAPNPADSTVVVSGTDLMGSLNARVFDSDLIEYWRNQHLTPAAVNHSDIFRFAADGVPDRIPNVGFNADGSAPPSARIIQTVDLVGNVTYQNLVAVLGEGQVEIIPKGTSGPILRCPIQQTSSEIFFLFKTYVPPPAAPDYSVIAEGRDRVGSILWQIRLADVGGGVAQLQWYSSGSLAAILDTTAYSGDWHSIFLWEYTPGTIQLIYDAWTGNAHSYAVFDTYVNQVWMHLGGSMNPLQSGKQGHVCHAYYSQVMAGGTINAGGYETFARPNTVKTVTQRFPNFRDWSLNSASTMVLTGTDNRNIALKLSQGRTVTDCLQDLSRTIAGTCWVRPVDNKFELLTGEQYRPVTPSFPIYLEADDDASLGQSWSSGSVENPTRQTVSWPGGETTYVDATAELLERRDGGTVDSMVTGEDNAAALAAYYVNRGKYRQLRQIGVDPVTAIGAGFDTTKTATANATGTVASLICTNADATDITVGDLVRLYISAGVLKESTVFTITAKVIAGSTTISFTPNAAAATVSTDQMRVAQPLWEALLTELQPGTRAQVRDLNPTVMGRTTEDVHVIGWTETWKHDSVEYLFNTFPADAPAESIIEDTGTVYDRMDFDAGAALTTTTMTTGSTSVTFSSTGPPLTVAGGDFPLYLRIGAEDLLVNSAPASAVTPQTVTVARAQRGSVAMAHAIGSAVNVTPLAGFGP